MVTALEHQLGVALKDSEEGKLSQLAELGMGYLVGDHAKCKTSQR